MTKKKSTPFGFDLICQDESDWWLTDCGPQKRLNDLVQEAQEEFHQTRSGERFLICELVPRKVLSVSAVALTDYNGEGDEA